QCIRLVGQQAIRRSGRVELPGLMLLQPVAQDVGRRGSGLGRHDTRPNRRSAETAGSAADRQEGRWRLRQNALRYGGGKEAAPMGPARKLTFARDPSGADLWKLLYAAPAPALTGLVLRYCGYVENTTVPMKRRELPFGGIPMIVHLGPAISGGA